MIQDVITHIQDKLSQRGEQLTIESYSPVGGGSINDSFKLKTSIGSFFLKVNSASKYPNMFKREFEGLHNLKKPGVIDIPEPIIIGEENDVAFIVMSFIEKGSSSPEFWNDFGFQLGALHRESSGKFGFEQDNYIGSLPQCNTWHDTWSSFFIHERLEPLVKKSRDLGQLEAELSKSFDRLYLKLENFFPEERPSLIHGDLWSGNFMVNKEGNPVIYDPAVYYGHREMDIAMSKLFGGFSTQFYEAYNDKFPMERGWLERLDVANLYPLLVHVILFGGSYINDVKRVLKRMLG